MLLQERIGLTKMPAPEESAVRRERRRMRRHKHQMVRVRDHLTLLLRGLSPQHVYDGTVDLLEAPDHRVGEHLLALSLMGKCLMRPHGQHRVQKEHTLVCPFLQTAVVRDVTAQILLQFLIDIYQGRRDLLPDLYGK